MGKVHVWGPPEEAALEADERLCSDPERESAAVVFHLEPVWLTESGWACKACGFSTVDVASGGA